VNELPESMTETEACVRLDVIAAVLHRIAAEGLVRTARMGKLTVYCAADVRQVAPHLDLLTSCTCPGPCSCGCKT
jgi:hypothetical protein